jgi:hypothetical protein
MIPIILYIDKTKFLLTGKLTLFPVTMSLSFFQPTRRQSRQSCAWCPLGFIFNKESIALLNVIQLGVQLLDSTKVPEEAFVLWLSCAIAAGLHSSQFDRPIAAIAIHDT